MNIDELDADLQLVRDTAPELYSDIFEVAVPFHQFHRKVFDGMNAILDRKYGLSQNEMDVLECLFYSGGAEHILTPTRLYERLLFSSGGITKIVAKLEKKGLIRYLENPEDKRSKRIQLSDAGEKAMRLALQDVIAHEESCYAALDPEELRELKRLLVKALRG